MEQQPVTAVKGIGPESARTLDEMGIVTVSDLMEHFPYRYEDYEVKDITEIKHEERVTLEGKVHSEPSLRYFGRKKSRMTVRFMTGRYLIKAVFFNQPFYKQHLNPGETVTITGKWDQHKQTITVSELKKGRLETARKIKPIYSVKGNVTQKAMHKWIAAALNEFGSAAEEILPERLLSAYRLPRRIDALQVMHNPASHQHLKQARRRFVYEEFLLFQLKLQAFKKLEREQSPGKAMAFSMKHIHDFIDGLPFSLTGAQQRAVDEILSDLKEPYRMNRLLQGDVGSGKTVVAAIALKAAVDAGYQGAMMAPTEILAEQHRQSLEPLLAESGISAALLTSSVKGKQRKELLARLHAGEIDVLIGTHALIQDEVGFKRLGLVITDEQHRFGVGQRRLLREKGPEPDVLFMTATPIPRTLAISVFGDMDVSVIDEMPAGRKTIETYWAKHDMLPRVLDFLEKEIRRGRQAYVICPLIEESEKLDVQNAIDVHAMLRQHFGDRYGVGLMHGRLSAAEKEEVMQQFGENKLQVLVSTTVVEVGVNVPNATVMVIYDAERFGLAQLHQLRGRVGRGSDQSYCILLADPKSETGKERMRVMTETNDGFELSERDLELRGPGDFFGVKQSGLPDFKVADVVHDYRALETARNDAAAMVRSEAFWKAPEYEGLRTYLQREGVFDTSKLD